MAYNPFLNPLEGQPHPGLLAMMGGNPRAPQAAGPQAAAPQAPGFGSSIFGDPLGDPSTYDWASPLIAEVHRNLSSGRDPFAGMKEAWASSPARHWGSDASDVAAQIAKLEQFAKQFQGTAGILSPNQLALQRYHQKVGLLPRGEATMQAAQMGGYGQGGAPSLYNEIAQQFFNQPGVKEKLGEGWQKAMSDLMYSSEQAKALSDPRIAQAFQLQSQAKEMRPSALEQWGPTALSLLTAPFTGGMSLAARMGIGAGIGAFGPMLFGADKPNLLGGLTGAIAPWAFDASGPLGGIASAVKDYLPNFSEYLPDFGEFLPDFGEAVRGENVAGVADDLGFRGPLSMFENLQGLGEPPPDLFFDDWGIGSNLSADSFLRDAPYTLSNEAFKGLMDTMNYNPAAGTLEDMITNATGGKLSGPSLPLVPWPGSADIAGTPERGALGKLAELAGMEEYSDKLKSVLESPVGQLGMKIGLPLLLTAYGDKAAKKQAEQMEAARLAQEKAVRDRFNTGPLGPYIPGKPRKYNAPTGDLLTYGQSPGSVEHTFYTAAEGGSTGRMRRGATDDSRGGQADDIPALLSEGEYVIPADVVSDLGDGSNEAGARKLDQLRAGVRQHKGRPKRLPPKAKRLEQYMKKGR